MKSTTSSTVWLIAAGIGWLLVVVALIAGLILIPRSNSDDQVEDQVESSDSVTVYEPVVVATYPHSPDAYTQGLEFYDGQLLESTGLVGQSSLRLVEPSSGEVSQSTPVDEPLFAEGVTVVGDEAWQLTWKAGLLLTYSLDDLSQTGSIAYDGEGWGLCATDDHLVMSNGSDRLTVRDRQTFAVTESVAVTNEGQPVEQINELECVGDTVWANIWQSPELIAIDRATGRVTGTVDLSPLLPPEANATDNVANGIAFDRDTGNFWLTGKRWSVMYEVDLQALTQT